MKNLLLAAAVLLLFPSLLPSQTPTSTPAEIEVFFSPHGGCTESILREVGNAKTSILVQAYSFTSAPIAKALVEAKKRGAAIQVILDKSQKTEKYSSADFLVNSEIPTRIDSHRGIAHNKVMVIDGETVITGSFNFTKAAEEHNAENLLVIRSRELARKYSENWNAHWEHSQDYQGRK